MSTTHDLRDRLAELRGPAVPPRPLDARALAALAANPGCRRRALLDAAGVDKGAVARVLGDPAPFGQSQFAFARGHAFEARVMADGCAELLRLLGAPDGERALLPDLAAAGPGGRVVRTRLALAEAAGAGRWSLLRHPLLALEVAGSAVYLEPDALAVAPDGGWTVVEVKSFPILDGAADPAKVGAAARQAAVYVLALAELADEGAVPGVLLVCPRDFSNLPVAEVLDVRKQLSVTRRQLDRLTRIDEIAAALPEGATFDLRLAEDGRTATRPPEELSAAVAAVPATYAPECLAACELSFHCRERSRATGAVEFLGRSARAELGALDTVGAVLRAARAESAGTGRDGGDGPAGAGEDPAAEALRRAAALRAEALAEAAGPGVRAVPPPAAVPAAEAVVKTAPAAASGRGGER